MRKVEWHHEAPDLWVAYANEILIADIRFVPAKLDGGKYEVRIGTNRSQVRTREFETLDAAKLYVETAVRF